MWDDSSDKFIWETSYTTPEMSSIESTGLAYRSRSDAEVVGVNELFESLKNSMDESSEDGAEFKLEVEVGTVSSWKMSVRNPKDPDPHFQEWRIVATIYIDRIRVWEKDQAEFDAARANLDKFLKIKKD